MSGQIRGTRAPAPGTVAVVCMMHRRAVVALFDGMFWRGCDADGPVKCVPSAITSIETPPLVFAHPSHLRGRVMTETLTDEGDEMVACPMCLRTLPASELCEHDDIDLGPLCVPTCCERWHARWAA